MGNLSDVTEPKVRILGISGSLRKGSYNTALLRAVQQVTPDDVEVTIFDLVGIPLYNGDVEVEGDPDTVVALKAAIRGADGVLFATPEYNHSTSGVLKNAVDWASRDRGEGSLFGKPVTVTGAGGASGTARAQMHLENILGETGSLVMVKPGFAMSMPWEKFDSEGNLLDDSSKLVLRDHIEAFVEWIGLVKRHKSAVAA
jgi:chromate reductase